jgi:hypothetical protein
LHKRLTKEITHMKRTLAITFLASMLISAVSGAYAQSKSTATIPFNFRVGSALLPAGSYEIKHTQSNLIWFRNLDGQGAAAVLASTTSGDTAPVETLIFNRYGDRYFLNETVSKNGVGQMTFGPTRLERSVKTEEANLQPERQVLVATK